jgi:hypothetical protein
MTDVITALAYLTIRGVFGNGDERRRRLGRYYGVVQSRTNQLMSAGMTTMPNDVYAVVHSIGFI